MTLADDAADAEASAAPTSGFDHVVAINVSPLFRGHSLVLPNPGRGDPQRLHEDGLTTALAFLASCTRSDAKLLFNSLVNAS